MALWKSKFGHLDILIVFISWITVLSWLILSERYVLFLRPDFLPLLVCACGLLIGFSVVVLSGSFHPHGSLNSMLKWTRAAVLVVPLVYLIAIRDVTLGAKAFENRSNGMGFVGKITAKRTLTEVKEADVLTTLELLQYFKEFEGKNIVTEGMVYKGEDIPNQYFMVYRFLMVCCAADSMPAGALVEHEEVDQFENDTWVRAEGILGLKEMESFTLPYIQADSLSIIEAPRFPYLIPSFRYR